MHLSSGDPGQLTISVSSFQLHPGYNVNTKVNNIAMIQVIVLSKYKLDGYKFNLFVLRSFRVRLISGRMPMPFLFLLLMQLSTMQMFTDGEIQGYNNKIKVNSTKIT